MNVFDDLRLETVLLSSQEGSDLSPEVLNEKVARLASTDWTDIPPGLRDEREPVREPRLITADRYWAGRRFSLWIAAEFYYNNLSISNWSTSTVICSARLDRHFDDERVGIRGMQISWGSFGSSAPPAGRKLRVVSTLGSASLKPGVYGLMIYESFGAAALLGGVFYVASAVGLSVDGKNVWKDVFAPAQSGEHRRTLLHQIDLL
jgi:hypothetical protein